MKKLKNMTDLAKFDSNIEDETLGSVLKYLVKDIDLENSKLYFIEPHDNDFKNRLYDRYYYEEVKEIDNYIIANISQSPDILVINTDLNPDLLEFYRSLPPNDYLDFKEILDLFEENFDVSLNVKPEIDTKESFEYKTKFYYQPNQYDWVNFKFYKDKVKAVVQDTRKIVIVEFDRKSRKWEDKDIKLQNQR